MKLFAATLAAAAMAAAAPALAQPYGPPGPSRGIPSDRAVNPAPGATRPYLGHPATFYDPAERLRDLDSRTASLRPRNARAARQELRRIHTFADTQRSRHGGRLRDWDRERMNRMMNDLVRHYPELRG